MSETALPVSSRAEVAVATPAAAPQTLNDLVRQRARQWRDRVAFRGPLGIWRFGDLDVESSRVAQGLMALDIGADQRVAVLTRHTTECLVLTLGAAKVGAVCMPVNWRLAPAEIDYILKNGDIRLLMVDADFAGLLDRIPAVDGVPVIVTEQAIGRWPSFQAWRSGFDALDPQRSAGPDDTALQLYSSGTTGLPKGVELTHRNLLANVRAFQHEFDYHSGDDGRPASVQLNALPTFHIAGMAVALLTLDFGGSSVMHPAFVPADVLKAIAGHRVTHMFLVPAMIQALVAQPDVGRHDLSSLECVSYGASPITDRVLVDAMRVLGCKFLQVYGLTETAGAVTCLPPADHDPGGPRAHLLRSAGRPGRDVGVRVVDAVRGTDCTDGEVGEIWIRSPQNMKGYWRNPRATEQAFPEGRTAGNGQGWFRTGDAGYLQQGYLYIHDRIKDMIITGGENVYPAEVENVMMQHPAVADGAVIGVPDDRWGEAVKACVVLKPGNAVTADDLIAFMRDRIAHYKCPKSVDFMSELPRNPSGKLLKFRLRKPYWEGRQRLV